ncbi:MAG: phage Gp37/Gp68 family protein [Geminicoccaceae bacterium]
MGDRTGIEWTDASWNPLRGCSRVSEGCRHCYAETVAARFSGPGQPYEGLAKRVTRPDGTSEARWTGEVELVEHMLEQPLRWKRPRRIFVNSMSDLFHESVPDEWIDEIFAVMACAPQHVFQVLSKRPERMLAYLTDPDLLERIDCMIGYLADRHSDPLARRTTDLRATAPYLSGDDPPWPLPNVWLGVSVEDQATADERIPVLLDTPAAVRWISAEPLLGPVDLCSTKGGTLWMGGQRGCGGTHRGIGSADCPREPHHHHDDRCKPGLDWVVTGGESGTGARPMHPDWARSLRDQCTAAGVPFLFKQNGEWVSVSEVEGPGDHYAFPDGATVRMTGKKRAGRTLDGRTWDQYPDQGTARA